MEPTKILIVDDHDIVRRGLRSILESENDFNIIGEASNGSDAVQKTQELIPDVVLMDLVMPGMDGITAIRKIMELNPNSKILVLTSFGDDEKVFSSIKAGATGYLLKSSPAEDLERAIRSVAHGELHLQAEIARKVLDEFSAKPSLSVPVAGLTDREKEVLTLIARNFTNKEIANHLCISIKTVKTHVSNILGKLHFRDRTEAGLFAMRSGLVQNQEASTNKT
jgi:NarL family two-component system response regulator LiaR